MPKVPGQEFEKQGMKMDRLAVNVTPRVPKPTWPFCLRTSPESAENPIGVFLSIWHASTTLSSPALNFGLWIGRSAPADFVPNPIPSIGLPK
jgi:hypothetical protein